MVCQHGIHYCSLGDAKAAYIQFLTTKNAMAHTNHTPGKWGRWMCKQVKTNRLAARKMLQNGKWNECDSQIDGGQGQLLHQFFLHGELGF